MQLVYFSSSEPAPKNAQNRFMHSQKHQGIPLITPLSLRRGVGGEAVRGCVSGCSFPIPSSQVQRGISLIDLPLPSERVGERLLRVCFRLFLFPSPFGEGWGEAASGVFQAAFSLYNQGRKHAYRTTFSAHKRKRRPRIAARPPPKSSI